MKKNFKKVLQSPILLIFVLVLILLSFFVTDTVIKKNKANEKYMIEAFKNNNKEINTMLYKAIKREADYKVDQVATEIRRKLVEEYQGDNERFINDYDNQTEESKIIKILNEVLEEKESRFFHVNNDKNDIYIISPKEILADKSIAKASETDSRTLENEIKKYPNRELAELAYKEILDGNTEELFIQNKGCNSDIIELNIDKVLSLPLEEIQKYEFLSISYIDEHGDIIGTPDVNHKGIKQNSRKIIIIQSFNMSDQIQDLGILKNYERIWTKQKIIIKNHKEERDYNLLVGILIIIIFMSSFIVMACFKNRFVRERDKSEF